MLNDIEKDRLTHLITGLEVNTKRFNEAVFINNEEAITELRVELRADKMALLTEFGIALPGYGKIAK